MGAGAVESFAKDEVSELRPLRFEFSRGDAASSRKTYRFSDAESDQVVLTVQNSSDESVTWVSNLDHVFADVFLGLPTSVSLQFRTADKKLIEFSEGRREDWIYPSVYNSRINVKGNKALGTVERLEMSPRAT